MSIIALGLSLCTAFTCNTYFIDQSETVKDCNTKYVLQSNSFVRAWNDTSSVTPLKAWLKRQKIEEHPATLISYNFECLTVPEHDIP